MNPKLSRAVKAVEQLPDDVQERLAADLLAAVARVEALEDVEDVRAYDEAKAAFEADGRRTVDLATIKARLGGP